LSSQVGGGWGGARMGEKREGEVGLSKVEGNVRRRGGFLVGLAAYLGLGKGTEGFL